jgi:hypothetical protein
MTPGQLAIAWELARRPTFVPIIGAKTIAQPEDALSALDHGLSESDLEALVKVSGDRCSADPMRHLDSERHRGLPGSRRRGALWLVLERCFLASGRAGEVRITALPRRPRPP